MHLLVNTSHTLCKRYVTNSYIPPLGHHLIDVERRSLTQMSTADIVCRRSSQTVRHPWQWICDNDSVTMTLWQWLCDHDLWQWSVTMTFDHDFFPWLVSISLSSFVFSIVCFFFVFFFFFFFQAEDGIRDVRTWLEFRRVLFRSILDICVLWISFARLNKRLHYRTYMRWLTQN